jgi:signal recognition particle GTPase
LLLQNQQQGMIAWAKQITGISEQVRRDIITRIEKMDKVLDAADERSFLEDLAGKRLGADVSFEEAQRLTELSRDMAAKRTTLTPENRLEYGRARVTLQNYVNDLKNATNKLTLEDFKANPGGSAARSSSRSARASAFMWSAAASMARR